MVAQLVPQRNSIQVGDAAVGAQGGDSLIFWAAVCGAHFIGAVFCLDHALTAHGAGVARIALFEDGVGHGFAADFHELLKVRLVVVVRRERAVGLLKGDHVGGAVERQAFHVGNIVDVGSAFAVVAGQCFGIMSLDALPALHHHGLEQLRTHHRAHASTPVGAVVHIHDCRDARHFLSGGADLQHLHFAVPGREQRIHFFCILPP